MAFSPNILSRAAASFSLLAAALTASGCGGSSGGLQIASAGADADGVTSGFIEVRRFWRAEEGDWVTVGTESTDGELRSWGYVDRHVQFLAPASPGADTVPVYRWYSAADQDWVTFRDGDPSDATIASWGYTHKTFSFHAYASPGPDRVEVSRWWSEKDRDWVTLADDEIPEATLRSWGYANKHPLFFAKRLPQAQKAP